MVSIANTRELSYPLPDHTQLPESDGTFVKNFQEHPQSILLTDSISPVLQQLHPDGNYCIGQDSGIYWRITDPPERGAEAPDWFYVANVPPTLNGQVRRSYVLWQELIAPSIVLEFVSGDGSEERDRTPWTGKFWIYEQVIRPPFYGIYSVRQAEVEVYQLIGGSYQLLLANERGHYSIPPLGVELGIWSGQYQNLQLPWLRWWDSEGNLLLTGEERAERERLAKEQAQQQAQQAQQQAELAQQAQQQAEQQAELERLEKERAIAKAQQLAAQLKALGIEPDIN